MSPIEGVIPLDMESIRMSVRERDRLEVLGRVKRGELTMVAASRLLGLSLRQGRRVWRRYKAEGARGLPHLLRDRVSNRRLPEEFRDRVVKRYQERYGDFGATLACEKLQEDGLVLSPDSLVAVLKERHLWVRRRRHPRHRRRRERRASFGMMVQMDGSHHDWFEGRSGKCVLMVMIDDATNQTYARFYCSESTESAFDVFGRWVGKYGLPWELYVDRHGIYRDDDHPQKPTQFGRAMVQLAVELILARSPQAKGRVERRHALFQDRLVKELRLRGISDMVQANAFLEQIFLPELNRRYAVKAAVAEDMHRTLALDAKLEETLCVQETRVVGQDWCVRWRNQWLQIGSRYQPLHLPRKRVLIKTLASGAVLMEYQGQRLEYQRFASAPARPPERKAKVNNRSCKPSANHPWRTPWAGIAPHGSLAPASPARGSHAGNR